jgi:hypothetical protein
MKDRHDQGNTPTPDAGSQRWQKGAGSWVDREEMRQRVLCVVLGLRDWTDEERRRVQNDPDWAAYEKYTRSIMQDSESKLPRALEIMREVFPQSRQGS